MLEVRFWFGRPREYAGLKYAKDRTEADRLVRDWNSRGKHNVAEVKEYVPVAVPLRTPSK